MQKRLEWLINQGYSNEEGSVTRTRTTTFLMPLIGISEEAVMKYHPKIFINAYIDNIENREIVIVLNKLDFPEESKNYVIIQNLNEHFVEFQENDEEYLIFYKIPEHFYGDFALVLQGKYSKTTDAYKSILLKIYGVERNTKDHKPTLHDCLYPDDIKRNLYANYLDVDVILIDEVSSRPRLKEYELFKTIEQLKQDYGTHREN